MYCLFKIPDKQVHVQQYIAQCFNQQKQNMVTEKEKKLFI